jgi:hypothetical protein
MYYTDKKSGLKLLIGVIGLDVMLSHLSKFIKEEEFAKKFVRVTPIKFKKNITPCYL